MTLGLCLLSLLIGSALPFAFAPYHLTSLGFISPALLLWIWLQSSPKQAGLTGFCFGLGFFGAGTSWVYISIHSFGHASPPLASFITAIFIFYLALYPALQGFLFRLLGRNKSLVTQSCLLFPVSWVAAEGLRGWLFTGFPWLLLGYSQLSTPLSGLAPLVGVYGVSWAVTLVSALLVLLATPKVSSSIKITAVVFVAFLMGGGWLLQKQQWTQPTPKGPLTVSLVQGNIAQSLKWNPNELDRILTLYKNLTTPIQNSQLIVWPEAAVPIFPQQVPSYFDWLDQEAKKKNTALLVGSPLYDPQQSRFYNGLELLGTGSGSYLKRHLVPFGEYTPLPQVFGKLMKQLDIPMSDFSKGPDQQPPLRLSNQLILAAFICYEIAFSSEVIQHSKNTQLLVNISDDSWFGQSKALFQQAEMAQFRALETGRPVLLTANTGITGIVSASGQMISALPINQRGVLTGKVLPRTGNTPLMRWKYDPFIALLTLLFLFALILS